MELTHNDTSMSNKSGEMTNTHESGENRPGRGRGQKQSGRGHKKHQDKVKLLKEEED